jgi:hypothetical protein
MNGVHQGILSCPSVWHCRLRCRIDEHELRPVDRWLAKYKSPAEDRALTCDSGQLLTGVARGHVLRQSPAFGGVLLIFFDVLTRTEMDLPFRRKSGGHQRRDDRDDVHNTEQAEGGTRYGVTDNCADNGHARP